MTSTYGVEKKHSTKDSSGLVLAVVLQPFHGDTLWSSKRQANGTVPDELCHIRIVYQRLQI
jgi:hypothetical protein